MSQLFAHVDSEKLSEMALVDIAYEILRQTNRTYNFRELMDELVAVRKMTKEQLMSIIAQVYTEINIDGRFVCLGDNVWGLKRWYPTDTVDETQEGGGTKKKKVILDDDFDDYDTEDDIVEEYEEDDVVIFEDEEEFVDEEAEIEEEEIEAEIDEEEIEDEEELFEDEELAEEESDEEGDDDAADDDDKL
ncbi:DNA-directed RNA polymerase subunit delta [Brevibacillus choshinensis]|uniref:DNA-directed RNA polymerase subunit delta n=1 Tax=Brevibacillus choshinensis TaxID=54911 RepID=UPI002E239A2C|nr:DNA-directed RNA polymerase subunit delta [Brevibacillus choshinensis]MED4583801.1 DNA-directed RNA polymerase subunit delta [Brevibacillus choshinensis]MED4751491.1 DNA-directed RNA polymerase subunit delta [Brevibacillus choshinensis]MED4780272.1 DNA-directed RNA polymerase subunit delta [Brevibacillus choshinensis]